MPKKRWPKIVYGDKRGITAEEHHQIIAAERDEETRDFYELLWQIGDSQSDMAALSVENIDWERRTISYARMKTGQKIQYRSGVEKVRGKRNHVAGGDIYHVARHQTRRSQGGTQVELRRSGDARSEPFGIDARRGNAMGDAADVSAI